MHAAKLPDSLRARAWRQLAVFLVNTALERNLFTLDMPAEDRRPAAPPRTTAIIELDGRRFELTVSGTKSGEVWVEIHALARQSGRWPRALVWVSRKQGIGQLQVPAGRRICREMFDGFTLAEQAQLAALNVEPVGYGFGPVVY
ncbi:hypothetical protein AB4Y36_19445 [Paraburkholderia sp. BR10936]|uniref:hypothetical protein n=1 Tax=Paraburkholderia sp. BR10936 TaxID=3236993 RepID=UPI0034D23056